jgi:hypothetical protein
MIYVEETAKLENLLSEFIDSKKIDVSKLSSIDSIINQSKSDQIRVLNNAYLSPDEQMILFGALRNIFQTTSVMKQRLEIAYSIGENPTTAESAFEIIPIIDVLSGYIDDFFKNREIYNLEKLELFSRNLYKKAKKIGFAKDVATQLKEEKIYEPQINSFVEKFNENIISELNLEDELGAAEDESIN